MSAHKIKGDISVDYLFDKRAPKVIAEHIPQATQAKYIVLLRDPVEGAISAYYWLLRYRDIENRPLEDTLRIALRTYKAKDLTSSQNRCCAELTRGFTTCSFRNTSTCFP